jgi:hypothetical protein
MDFGTFPHLAYQLMSAAEQHLCPLQGAVYRYIGGMLWDEFGQHHSILLSRAMDFGTFPHLAYQLMSAAMQQLCPIQEAVCRYIEGML